MSKPTSSHSFPSDIAYFVDQALSCTKPPCPASSGVKKAPQGQEQNQSFEQQEEGDISFHYTPCGIDIFCRERVDESYETLLNDSQESIVTVQQANLSQLNISLELQDHEEVMRNCSIKNKPSTGKRMFRRGRSHTQKPSVNAKL